MSSETLTGTNMYIPIGSLEHNHPYEQVFLVAAIKYNQSMKARTGQPFARLTLKDTTGELEGVVWDYSDNLQEGDYALVSLDTKVYRGEIEFQAQGQNVRPTAAPQNQYDYVLGVSEHELTAYAGEVEDELISVSDPIYRDVMGNAIHRLDLMQALKESPYGITGPMAYRGGLLVHVVHSMRLARVATNQASELDMPFSSALVMVGCALRNIGWHTTTRFQGDHLRSRDAYHMTGIYRASARYIDHLMLTTESNLQIEIPESKRQALENICNRRADIHTLEGKIVACADNMADVLDFGVDSLQQKQRGSWNNDLFTGHL